MPNAPSPSEAFLPEPLLDKVLDLFPTWIYGVEGIWSQARLVNEGFREAQTAPELIPFAASLLYWAWQQRPLDPTLLSLLLQSNAQCPWLGLLPAPQERLLRIVAKGLRAPSEQDRARWAELNEAGAERIEQIRSFLFDRAQDAYWIGEGFDLLLSWGRFAEAGELLDAAAAPALTPLLPRLQAELAFHQPDARLASERVAALDPALFGWLRGALLASLAERAGEDADAAQLLAPVVRAFPWHANLLLKYYELTAARPALRLPDERTSVCALVYSWNKAEDLAMTLETLRASALGACRVVALDNGSSDGTSATIQRFQQAWPHPGGFDALRLPVNIGAPAARNWLLSLPQVQAAAYVAYLDDDIILPADWLGQLLGQALTHPEAGAVGCNIVGHLTPHAHQAADFHLLDPERTTGGFADFQERVFVANNCIGLRDTGMFRYSRPCVTVTGCCHLLSRASLDEAGGFDIRFSPSQFDDLDRDLRAYAHGRSSFYAGRLQIKHVQHSSLSQASSTAKQAHIHGNKLKLEGLHSLERLREIYERDQAALREDLKRKVRELREIVEP